jgi:hypothetical protein
LRHSISILRKLPAIAGVGKQWRAASADAQLFGQVGDQGRGGDTPQCLVWKHLGRFRKNIQAEIVFGTADVSLFRECEVRFNGCRCDCRKTAMTD